MKKALLNFLREPDTGAELDLQVAEWRDDAVWTGSLRSRQTGKVYPIHAGIPRFVPTANYADSFGLQWNRFSRVQLDSANGASYSRQRFLAETGWTQQDLTGKWALDAGCGSGRFAEVAAGLGANVIALDYSSAVDAAALNLAGLANVHFVQADLLHPPFKVGALDFAYSIGVVQHTPRPLRAIAAILRLLKPGGGFAFTIYGRRWYTKLNAKYLLRPLTKRLPPRLLLASIELAMPLIFPVTSVLFALPRLGKVASFLIPVATYANRAEFTPEQRLREATLDTFDMLAPAFDNPLTAAEVQQVLARYHISACEFRTKVPVNVVGSLPHAGRPGKAGAPDAGH